MSAAGTPACHGATCSETNGIITCALGDLVALPDASLPQRAVTITLRPTAAGTVRHDPRVSATGTIDPDQTDNADPVDVMVWPRVDLALDGAAAASTVRRGGQVTHTFTVTNNGPDTSTGGAFTTTAAWDPPVRRVRPAVRAIRRIRCPRRSRSARAKTVFALANGTVTFKFGARAGVTVTAAFETSTPVAARVAAAAKKRKKVGVKVTVKSGAEKKSTTFTLRPPKPPKHH